MSVRLFVLAMAMIGAGETGAMGKGGRMRVLDGIDRLVKARNESADAIGRVVLRPLAEAGSTDAFTVLAATFADDSPFARIEVRKPRKPPLQRGLMIVDIHTASCVPADAVMTRYGQVDDLAPPRPPMRAPSRPANRPTDYIYHRPWGKLSFGFVDTPAGQCLSRAVIDWTL